MKSFIIRLKNNATSEKYAGECVAQAKKFGIDVEYFDAVNGNEYPEHLVRLGIEPKYRFKKGRAGVFGCFLSHYYLWQQCSQDNVPYIILEHDGYFIKPLPDNILDKFDDVLKLDNLDPYSKHYETWLVEQQEFPLDIQKYYNDQAKCLDKNQTGNYMRGAYSYIIKPRAARKILDWIKINGFVPADQQLGSDIVDIQVTIPTVVRLHPAYFNNVKEMSLTRNPEKL